MSNRHYNKALPEILGLGLALKLRKKKRRPTGGRRKLTPTRDRNYLGGQ